jgi:Rieske Fe-S protein
MQKVSNKNSNKREGEEETSFVLIESLGTDEGTVFEDGEHEAEEKKDSPLAVYKARNGETHTFSVVCTHLGCTVTWNNLEKSFDSTCHGSCFSNRGKVINYPAIYSRDSREPSCI